MCTFRSNALKSQLVWPIKHITLYVIERVTVIKYIIKYKSDYLNVGIMNAKNENKNLFTFSDLVS